jgi:hypothetical protein
MGGGLMQLVAYGAQDVYLSGNPQITFFKVVYRRHTNFSVEPIQQTWNGAADFGRSVTCNINRNGDLITNMYVVVRLNAQPEQTTQNGQTAVEWGFVNRLGHALIANVKIEIGGSKIDEQYGDWLNIWYELTHKSGQERGYAKMIGDVPELTTITKQAKKEYQMYIPLQFWFNRNNGLALPLIALQYHDVRVTLVYRPSAECINYIGTKAPTFTSQLMADSYLLIDYVYLDSEERKRFAQASHEYLIEQLQYTGSETVTGSTNKYRLNFNHPSKYLIWAHHLAKFTNNANKWLAYASDGNWDAARDRFAKILACASSVNFSEVTATTGVAEVTTGGLTAGTIYYQTSVASGETTVDNGELLDFIHSDDATNKAASLFTDSTLVKTLLAKISVKFIAQSNFYTKTASTNIPAGNYVAVGKKSDGVKILDNMIVTKNELTMSDISNALSSTMSTSTATKDFVSEFTYSVTNLFNYGNNLDGSDNVCTSAKLQLNGHDRFQLRDGHYFNYVQPAQHFSNTPADGINVYSFALKAEDHQPTGTCNFSRIDNATLQVDIINVVADSNNKLSIFTQNYNVLRVMSGMAGTAYSN